MPLSATATLEPVDEARVALEAVNIQASLRGLLSEIVVSQTYRNLENRNIEAVYTFPLPLDAVLLELTLELNGKTLQGVVQATAEAEESYEDAIEAGDSALLLQQLEPGLFTVNVGNIQPNERAIVRFNYALLHRWQGDSLRLHLPTTIAPRYGNPSTAGLAEHQIPEFTLTADHGFSLVVEIEGDLAQASFECPSHPLAVAMNNGTRRLSLSGGSTLMDRDFILVIKEPFDTAIEAFCYRDNTSDNGSYVALASFHPDFLFRADQPQTPRYVKLVVDCSGSMSGDSIAQAKAALHEILALLQPNDYFNLITFGSRHKLLFAEPVTATETNIHQAAQFLNQLDANMGGTEIGSALQAAYNCGTAAELAADLLLITDGEVWPHEEVITAAQNAGHRIFTVGVGSAVSEAFVRRIAESTGGACELVSPRENMSERIVRHFGRIDQPQAAVQVEWPQAPARQLPAKLETVYAGDTLHVFGWFNTPPVGEVRLKMTLKNGDDITQTVPVSKVVCNGENEPNNLPRVAAHSLLQTLDDDEAVALAVKYQLVTDHTSCVLVFDRGEEAKGVPALRKVPQVLAAGWGGVGAVHYAMEACASYSRSDRRMPKASRQAPAKKAPAKSAALKNFQLDSMVCAKRISVSAPNDATNDFSQLVARLNDLYSDDTAVQLTIERISDLTALALDEDIADQLLALVADGAGESVVVVCFLAELSKGEAGKALSRHVSRLIRKANKENAVSVNLAAAVAMLVGEH